MTLSDISFQKQRVQATTHPALADPWAALASYGPEGILAILTKTEGPAYRNIGSAMAIGPDGQFAGAISSGCIEADLMVNAGQMRAQGLRRLSLRYGKGSPFVDLPLPCGGAIEVTLLRSPPSDALDQIARARAARQTVGLEMTPEGGFLVHPGADHWPEGLSLLPEGHIRMRFAPALRVLAFGAGPEVAVFAGLVQSLGYDCQLYSHEDSSLDAARIRGCRATRLSLGAEALPLPLDAATAAVLFYHDHDYEPMLLARLLESQAFYIGAQGSRATQAARLGRLSEMGVCMQEASRLRGPIGLIKSSREPRSLAVSVLGEILETAAKLPISLS